MHAKIVKCDFYLFCADLGCTDDYPHLYEDVYTGDERCCEEVPGENEYEIPMCLVNSIGWKSPCHKDAILTETDGQVDW